MKRLVLLVLFVFTCMVAIGCDKLPTSKGTPAVPSTTQDVRSTTQDNQSTSQQASGEVTLEQLMQAARNVPGMSYEMITTVTTPAGTRVSSELIWASGKKARMEMDAMGQKFITISTAAGDVYEYNPTTNSATKYTVSQTQQEGQVSYDWANQDPVKYKIIGKETLDGQACTVVTMIGGDNQGENKMWIRNDIGMPVRMEMTKNSGNNAVKMVMENKNFKIGPQPDSLFELPAGVTVSTMPNP